MAFPKDFLWGAATAAAQIEGGWDKGGRTPSVWDVLPVEEIKNGDSPKIGCNHYEHWKQDVEIIRQLGLKAYRFSISWSRVMPHPGKVSTQGLRFYTDLVAALTRIGVEPMVTLYHWDMPVWADEMGGWTSDAVVDAFEEYVKAVVNALSGKVRWWFTFNEPQMFATDVTTKGKNRDVKDVTRHVILAHGRAVQCIRRYSKQPCQIGLAIMGLCMTPIDGMLDETAAEALTFSDMAGVMGMSWWLDPIILGNVPEALKDILTEDDLQTIHQPLDFFEGNVYFSANYHVSPGRHNRVRYPGYPESTAEMPITPECLYWFPKFCWHRYHLPVLITENGFANTDFVMSDGCVHDPQRTDFLARYLQELQRAVDEGTPILGYLYWSLLDNFEWTSGYDKRFGLVYVDYRTQKRTIKDSAYYYADFIKKNS